jgi:two-component system OmpR family sensor kinase
MRSIRWRLTLYHTIAILGISSLLLGIGLVALYQSVRTGVEETTQGRAVAAERLLAQGNLPSSEELVTLTEGEVYLIVRDESGAILATAGTPPLRYDELGADGDRAWQAVLASGEPATDSSRELHVTALPVDGGTSGAAVVEAWKSYDTTAESYLPDVRILTFLIPAAVLLAIGGSWLLVSSSLKPVQQITAAAQQIGDESLDRRLPVERPDEIGELAMTINNLLARLEVAIDERDEALDQQRRFLADAGHELRTPLTAIRGYARMLNDWALDDPALARESIAAIDRDATRMTLLVEQLLVLARGDDLDLSPRLAQTDLAALARGAAADANRLSGNRHAITVDAPETAFAEVDAMQIRQVLDILLDNAIKYSPPGAPVALRVTRSPGSVTIAVTDSGPGIPDGQLPYLFDRFYRADPSRSSPGAGLGLAIAKQIVARHGGSLTAENAPTGGARFTLRLPSSGSSPATADTAATPPTPPATH